LLIFYYFLTGESAQGNEVNDSECSWEVLGSLYKFVLCKMAYSETCPDKTAGEISRVLSSRPSTMLIADMQ
jgi:hypothetical protein